MPRLRSTGWRPNERAICGNAVAMIVPSRFSMKNVAATSMTTSDDPRVTPGAALVRVASGACIEEHLHICKAWQAGRKGRWATERPGRRLILAKERRRLGYGSFADSASV